MEEFIIIDEPVKVAQKLLNQWRHIYDMTVFPIGSYYHPEGYTIVTLIVSRDRKEAEENGKKT